MGSMRQRLLLVAGWAAAAVVATLVSTGAVAVAGGQVTDRPLSPLSASEVAALTEGCGTPGRAPCLRQLDNPVVSTTTVVAAPDLNSGQTGDEQGVSPSTSQAPDDPLAEDPLDPDDTSLVPQDENIPEPSGEIVELVGARVSISGADGEITVIWAIPSPGFAPLPTGTEIAPGSVTLSYSDGSHRSTVTAEWDPAEGLVIQTTEGGLNFTES